MAWINIPASISLVNEFNAAFPERDKASDGTIGDGEHSQTSSDHNPDETGRTPYEDNDDTNEVHARDVDDDLRKAGWSMQRVVDIILARCRSGAEKRIRYIIYNRRIISASWGWGSWHAYDGPSPHTEHAHFSFFYGSGNGVGNPENITSPWGFLAAVQEDEDMTKDDMLDLLRSAEGQAAIADACWKFGKYGPVTARETNGDRMAHVDLAVDDLSAAVADVADVAGRVLIAVSTTTAPPPAG